MSLRRKILITGASGLLGRHVVEWFSHDHEVMAARHQDFNIAEPESVHHWMRQHTPDIIINCAAMSQVDRSETHPDEAFAANAEGPHLLAQAAGRMGAELVHISTDYVFDGEKTTPYTIEDEPRPISRYGESKRAGEVAVRDVLERHYIIRVARLFGRGGKNFASAAIDMARQQGRILAIVDEIGSPTYVFDLAERIHTILQFGQYGTYHVTNQGACSWAEFAVFALDLGQVNDVIIEKVKSADLGRPARRPRYTEMRCLLSERLGLKPLRPWEAAYTEFVQGG